MRRAIRLNFWSTFQVAIILQKPKSSDILTTLTLRYSPEEVREETGRRGGLWNQCSWVHWAKLWPESFQHRPKKHQSHLKLQAASIFCDPVADWVLDRSSKNRHASLAIHGPPGCRRTPCGIRGWNSEAAEDWKMWCRKFPAWMGFFHLRYKKIPLHDVFSRNCSETICIYNKHGNTPDSSRIGHSEYVCW